jgi:uncharacterized protein YjiS (DUF1127 family)
MSILNLFLSAGRAFAEWRRRERAYAELMALDDRSLADIGVRRSQIRAMIAGADVRDRETGPGPVPEAASFWSAHGRLNGLTSRPIL